MTDPDELSAFVRTRDAASILATLGIVRRIWSPWAILLTCFQDDPPFAQLTPIDHYKKLFTSAGANTMNVVNCFSDMSHGKLDLSGSQVFGWYRLTTKRSNYIGNVSYQPAGKLNREGLRDAAKAAAVAAGVPLTNFAGVCVASPDTTDLCGWVGGMAALCDDNSLSPSWLGQEMGHGYGLNHARMEGDEEIRGCPGPTPDYQDQWDLMSTGCWSNVMASNPDFGTVGPGLNAWNMRSRGWLNERRVWSPMDPTVPWDETLILRPLHQPSEAGWLAADLGPYLVELRVREKWDAAIPRSCVLVHRFQDGHSCLQRSVNRNQDLVKGDRFVGNRLSGSYELEVLEIDEGNKSATVHLRGRPAWRRPRFETISIRQLLTASGRTGDGLVLSGRAIDVPLGGPERALLEQISIYLRTPLEGDVAGALAIRRAALTEIVRLAAELYAEAETVSEQPPGYPGETAEPT
jgi:hypothetical protein